MAVMATLTQGLTLAEARALAAREREALGSMAALDATVAALTDALPASEANRGVASILPDIVGEGAVLAWFGSNGALAARGVDPAERVEAAAKVSLRNASATLVRTAQDFAAAGYAEPIQWLEALVSTAEADVGALMQIAGTLPDRTLALREMAAGLYVKITDSLRESAKAEAAIGSQLRAQALYAESLRLLGGRFGALGRGEEALSATQEATDIYRRLATARPDAFLPGLATSLNDFGNRLSALGRREEALAAAQEATGIYRRLAAARPDEYLPNLALSLSNLVPSLGELGQREDALAAAREVASIHQRLADARPDAFAISAGGAPKGLRYTRMGSFFDRNPGALDAIPFCLDQRGVSSPLAPGT